MSIGLIALFDEIAAIAKVATASLDDVANQAAKAGSAGPSMRQPKQQPVRCRELLERSNGRLRQPVSGLVGLPIGAAAIPVIGFALAPI